MMQVVELTGFGDVENLHLAERQESTPGPGEVEIAVMATAINPIDYKLRQGRFGGQVPMVLGHDVAGVVRRVGSGVTGLKEGDEVWSYLGGPKSNGSYAEYVCVPESFVSKKPINLNFTQAAAVPLTGLTAYEAVIGKARIAPGQSVLITGSSGGVGTMAVQLCRHLGAGPIIATAGSQRSFDYLRDKLEVPSEHIIFYRDRSLEDLEQQVYAINGGRPVEAAFDFVGHRMKQLCLRVIGFGGSVVSIVEEPADFALDLFDGRNSPLFTKSASLHFEFLAARALSGNPVDWQIYRQNLENLCQLFESEKLCTPGVSDIGKFSEAAIRGGHSMLEEGDVQGKLVVRFR